MKKQRKAIEDWEVSIIKAMYAENKWNHQEILSYFTRPSRSVNHRVIGEIVTPSSKNTYKYSNISMSSKEELDYFLNNWPDIDENTGLSLKGDELVIKAREAMISAIHNYNSAGITFKCEIFIVTAVIAWTYLLHAWFKKNGIDFRYYVGGKIVKTKGGAEKYWELSECLVKCDLIKNGVKNNLLKIIEIRHEIEHRSTGQIDDKLSSTLQQCCINFNEQIKSMFGNRFGLERRITLALQLVTFDAAHFNVLKKANNLPKNIETTLTKFHSSLSEEELKDPSFSYRYALVPLIGKKANTSDSAIEVVKLDDKQIEDINTLIYRDVEKIRYTAQKIVEKMNAEGFSKFKMHHHTALWQKNDAKRSDKGFGQKGDYNGYWVWNEKWVDIVRNYCIENLESFK